MTSCTVPGAVITAMLAICAFSGGCSSNGGYNGTTVWGQADSNTVKIGYTAYNKGSTVAAEAEAHCKKYDKTARLKECATFLLVCEYECVKNTAQASPESEGPQK